MGGAFRCPKGRLCSGPGGDDYTVSVALGKLDPFANTQLLLAYDGADGKASFDHLRPVVSGDVRGARSVQNVAGIGMK